jgi:hypothetical protein
VDNKKPHRSLSFPAGVAVGSIIVATCIGYTTVSAVSYVKNHFGDFVTLLPWLSDITGKPKSATADLDVFKSAQCHLSQRGLGTHYIGTTYGWPDYGPSQHWPDIFIFTSLDDNDVEFDDNNADVTQHFRGKCNRIGDDIIISGVFNRLRRGGTPVTQPYVLQVNNANYIKYFWCPAIDGKPDDLPHLHCSMGIAQQP